MKTKVKVHQASSQQYNFKDAHLITYSNGQKQLST